MSAARVMALVFLFGFGGALGIVVAQRLSAESMAVIVGVLAGVAASVPTSVVVAWMAGKMAQRQAPPVAPPSEPRIVVVPPMPTTAGTSGYPGAGGMPTNGLPRLEPGERRFRVIGGSEVEIDGSDIKPVEEATWQR